jgi:hypothetical protein
MATCTDRVGFAIVSQVLRPTYLSYRVFENHTAILGAPQNGWRRLFNVIGRIASIATPERATIG